jgi:hypothetical protein
MVADPEDRIPLTPKSSPRYEHQPVPFTSILTFYLPNDFLSYLLLGLSSYTFLCGFLNTILYPLLRSAIQVYE